MDTGIDSTGHIGQFKSIDEYLPTIKKGVTTKDQMVAALGEPQNDTTSSYSEILLFRGETPFWKSGGVGQLLMGRAQIKILYVTLQNGVVTDYTLQQTWVNQ